MKRNNLKELEETKNKTIRKEGIDPDHFTVFDLKMGWEKEMADVWSPDEIQKFKERQELLCTIPLELRDRTKIDKSYREGWIDGIEWIHQEIQKIFHSRSDVNT